MKYERPVGTKDDFTDKERIEQIIRSNAVLTALYKRPLSQVASYVETLTTAQTKTVVAGLCILAWILIRKLTKE
jgi:hypothetical protein